MKLTDPLVFVPIMLVIIPLIISGAMFYFANVARQKTCYLTHNCTAATEGMLVAWNYRRMDCEKVYEGRYYPLYAYDVDGRHYEEEESIYRRSEGEVGIAATIHYNPKQPAVFYTDLDQYQLGSQQLSRMGRIGVIITCFTTLFAIWMITNR